MKTVKVKKSGKCLRYRYVKWPNSGYSFPIDKDGRLMLGSRRADYYKARLATKHGEMICDGIVDEISTVVICPICGRDVYLQADAYTCGTACECGAVFDEYGTMIADKDGKIDYIEPYDTAYYY